jgi:hypothetical protein
MTDERRELHLSEAKLFYARLLFLKTLFIYKSQTTFKTSYSNQKIIFRFYSEFPELMLRAKRNLGGSSAAT